MRADIDEQQRLMLQPETMTERTALFAWFEALPPELRAELEPRVLRCSEPQPVVTATEARDGMQALLRKGAEDIEPAWQEFGVQLAKAIDESMRAARSKGSFL